MTDPFFFDSTEILGSRRMRKRGGTKQAPTRGPGGCEECGLWRQCRSPKMEPYGKNELRIAVVGMQPGKVEDKKGRPFVGPSGDELRPELERLGIQLTKTAPHSTPYSVSAKSIHLISADFSAFPVSTRN